MDKIKDIFNMVVDSPNMVNNKLPWNSWNSCMDDSEGNLAKWTGDFFRVGAFVMLAASLYAIVMGIVTDGMGEGMAVATTLVSSLLWVYAAFPIVTSDGYTLGTLCVSDNKVRKLTKHKISLLMGLATKLAYQLEVQVSQRKGTAESTIHILNKLLLKYPNLKVLEAISVLKFIIKDFISLEEQKLIVKLGLGFESNNEY